MQVDIEGTEMNKWMRSRTKKRGKPFISYMIDHYLSRAYGVVWSEKIEAEAATIRKNFGTLSREREIIWDFGDVCGRGIYLLMDRNCHSAYVSSLG